MDRTRVVVRCGECEFQGAYGSLRDARVALAEHERDTGHAVDWRIDEVAAGVKRAGADAGVCGRPECVNTDSPLVRRTGPKERE
ncbi:hypothetical protein GRS48_11440 [Halorubrum sp. JWXQ-INN 858]|uniref:DUF7542 family protein n=1 Tax=Halorubrum sp. JWXQ-INN 858 TaxID=2690782 RepID=UPI001358441E|nr:hypothetical protein [Halorubrum sp. JWXQ-INN 858]MWV65425.1 hypothetical protein [Halorubrum sp. JWXQ-INN 858]